MKISGFTFVKNAVKYDYPVVESIKSILPLVDEMIVSLGDSEDETNALIESIGSEKIKIVHSVWDKNLREGGRVLAVETDKAMDAVSPDADWLIYIQADEVIHEKYHAAIRNGMEDFKDDERIEGLLFKYLHFYGSYKYLGDGRSWYNREIRIIRNDKQIRSYRDAQGFRKNDRKLKVKLIEAYVYHYGWVKNPLFMNQKQRDFGKLWNDDQTNDEWVKQLEKKGPEFDYSTIDSIALFKEDHPAVMKSRVENENWNFEHNEFEKKFKNTKHRFLYFLDKKLGIKPFTYKNYKII